MSAAVVLVEENGKAEPGRIFFVLRMGDAHALYIPAFVIGAVSWFDGKKTFY